MESLRWGIIIVVFLSSVLVVNSQPFKKIKQKGIQVIIRVLMMISMLLAYVVLPQYGLINLISSFKDVSPVLLYAVTIASVLLWLIAVLLFIRYRDKGLTVSDHNLLAFREELTKQGITDLSDPYNKEKAKLIAKKFQISPEELDRVWEESEAARQKKDQIETDQKLEEMKREEIAQSEISEYFSDFVGNEKRYRMWKTEGDHYAALESEATKKEQQILRQGQKAERDWATAGGIASAIGGVGAGVATALEAQSENEQIRADNARYRKIVYEYWSLKGRDSDKYEEMKQKCYKKAESAKLKVVTEEAAASVFNRLVLDEPTLTVTDTGTIVIDTQIRAAEPIRVYDRTEGVVDGTLLAKIYDRHQGIVGVAKLVLPRDGVGVEWVPLKGYLLFAGKPGETYSCKFAVQNLWVMEV